MASQKAMLERLGRKGGRIGDAALMRTYAGQLVQVQNWLRKTPGVQVMTVDYAEALRDQAGTAERLGAFFGRAVRCQGGAREGHHFHRRHVPRIMPGSPTASESGLAPCSCTNPSNSRRNGR